MAQAYEETEANPLHPSLTLACSEAGSCSIALGPKLPEADLNAGPCGDAALIEPGLEGLKTPSKQKESFPIMFQDHQGHSPL